MGHGKHSSSDVWVNPEPRSALSPSHVDSNSDTVSIVRDWLTQLGATADTGRAHYRRTRPEGRDCAVRT